ncbi:MAG TPA: Ig-like domain-containing protein [Solimonas sp.]|nr:Ig-like domain-containing protein [Solimonas sp.]
MRAPLRWTGCTLLLVACAALADEGAEDEAPVNADAPWSVSCDPADGALRVGTGVHPAFDFGRQMNPGTINPRTFSLSGPGATAVAGAPAYSGTVGTFVPAAALSAGTAYSLKVNTGARDRDGNALPRDYACAFTTAPVAAAVVRPASAAEADPLHDRRWYVAPMLAYVFPTCDDCLERGTGWQLALGKAVSEHWNLELAVTDRKLDLKRGPGSSHDTSYGAAALWLPDRTQRFAPFALIGAGAHHQAQDPDKDSTVPYGTAGAGFLYNPFHWNPTIRGGAQWIRPFGGDYCGKGDTLATLGLQFQFGG